MAFDAHEQSSFVTHALAHAFAQTILIFARRVLARTAVEKYPRGTEDRQEADRRVTLADQEEIDEKRGNGSILLHSGVIFQRDLDCSDERRETTD